MGDDGGEELARAAETVRAAFRLADDDGDGVISGKEMRVLFKNLGMGWSDEQFERFFDEADENNDGVIQYEEFIDWIFKSRAGSEVREADSDLFPDAMLQQACADVKHLVKQQLARSADLPEATRLVVEAVFVLVMPQPPASISSEQLRRFVCKASFASAVAGIEVGKLSCDIWRRVQEEYLDQPAWDRRLLRRASKQVAVLGLWVEMQVGSSKIGSWGDESASESEESGSEQDEEEEQPEAEECAALVGDKYDQVLEPCLAARGDGEPLEREMFPQSTVVQVCSDMKHLIKNRRVLIGPLRLVVEAVVHLLRPEGAKANMSTQLARRSVARSDFGRSVADLGGEDVLPQSIRQRVRERYIEHQDWDIDKLRRISKAAAVIALWVEFNSGSPGAAASADEEEEPEASPAAAPPAEGPPLALGRRTSLAIARVGSGQPRTPIEIARKRSQKPDRLAYASPKRKERLRLHFPFQGYIPDTEHRGITFRQLKKVKLYVARYCHYWIDTSPACMSATSGQPISLEIANLYHLNTWVIKPATTDKDCAFAELLSKQPQTPKWFISHWWGEVMVEFMKCVEKHMEVRGGSCDDPYWVCAYANRQHSLDAELSANPRDTSFFRAMQLALGVLLVLDARHGDSGPATPFTRIWCDYEESVAVETGRLMLDIATCHQGRASLLTQGVAESDKLIAKKHNLLPTQQKMSREKSFPLETIQAGLKVEIQRGNASVEDDRVHILNAISEQPLETRPPLEEHENYDRVNCKLRAVFAMAAWRNAMAKNKLREMSLPETIAANRWMENLSLDVSEINEMLDTDDLGSSFQGLKELTVLVINMDTCMNLHCLAGLGNGLASGLEKLQDLTICLKDCMKLCDMGPLFAGIGALSSLQRLEVRANGCAKLGELGLDIDEEQASMGFGLLADLPDLETVHLDFEHCRCLAQVQPLIQALKGAPSLRNLHLNLIGCVSLPPSLQRFFTHREMLEVEPEDTCE